MLIDSPASPNDVTSNQSRNSHIATNERQSPNSPPINVSTRFSINTCPMIFPFVAPKARRTPSSAIRLRILENVIPERFSAGTSSKTNSMIA